MRRLPFALAVPLIAALTAPVVGAQEQKAPEPLQVGATAPDFTLPGATRYGTLRARSTSAISKGKTVVLAFFYKARTKG